MNRRLAALLATITLTIVFLDGPGIARQPIASVAAENFDIRTSKAATPSASRTRLTAGRVPAFTSQLAARRAGGVTRLRASYPSLTIVNSHALGLPEVVGRLPGSGFLSTTGADRVATLRTFLTGHGDAFGLAAADVSSLQLIANYQNPSGNMAWVELEQRVNGLPIFQGTVRGGFTAAGQLVRTTGALVPAGDAGPLPTTPSLSAPHAIALAAANVGWPVDETVLVEKSTDSEARITFATANMADDARAWRLYFPVAPGVLRLAWATEIVGDPMGYLSIIDALDGTLLFRKNLTSFQTQPATYSIYAGDSPAPLSPTTAVPGSNTQPPAVPRTMVTVIGNEAPNTFNTLGWMTDGANLTDGNNVEAGVDLVAPNGIDSTTAGTGRVFDFAYNPAPGLPGQGDVPTTADYRNGEVTNMFYWTNVYHDRLYMLGFTEAAHNFQHDNFDRGGVGGDRVRAEAQDYSGVNNANFMTPTDGGRGRMQMYRFTGPNPDRASGLDQDIMLHELTHGTSNRLHANGTGLATTMASGMGEGWSDFYARSLLSTPDEDVNAVYSMAGWSTLQMAGNAFTDNYFSGIRRFPYAVMSTVGGASNRPYNPLTFADIDSTQRDLTDGAYPASAMIGGEADQVHNMGEVWASALFEVRARFITRLGHEAGNTRILQFVTDAMKLDPGSPTMPQARDSLLTAAAASGTVADMLDIWAGFAVRGLGASAQVLTAGDGNNTTRVIEAFDVPGLAASSATLVSEAAPSGSFDAGELVGVAFCVTNHSLEAIGPVTGTLLANASLASPSAPQDFGTVASGGSACRTFTFTVAASCGETIAASLDLQAPQRDATVEFQFDAGFLTSFFFEGFDNIGPLDLPEGWSTSTLSGTVNPWGASPEFASTAPNSALVADLAGVSDSVLDSPVLSLPAGGSRLTFNNHFQTEWGWDGGVLEISVADGPYQDIETAGGTFARNGYTKTLETIADSPIGGRRAWTGGFVDPVMTAVDLPPSAAGQDIRLRWRMGSDQATDGIGWAIDNVSIAQFACSVVQPPTAVGNTYTMMVNTQLNVPIPGILGNDTGAAETAALVTNVAHGTLELAANGSFTYVPAAGFAGADQFTYQAHNLVGASNVATVSITVQGVLAATVGDAYSTPLGIALTVPAAGVLANDTGTAPLAATLISDVAHGNLALAADGSFTYTPAPAFVGVDTFAYRASNVVGPGNTATVTLTVAAPTTVQPPTGVYAASIAGNTVLLRWQPPTPGPAPTGFIIEGGVAPGEVLATFPTGSAAPGFSLEAPTGAFYVRVHSLAGEQRSAASNEIRIFVETPAPPSAPTNVLALVNGSRVGLSWRNTFDGGMPTSLVLDYTGSLTGSIPFGLMETGMLPDVPDGSYTLQLRALNNAGSSAPSAPVTLTLPGVCSGAPQPPISVQLARVGNVAYVLWDLPSTGSAPLSYIVNVSGAYVGSILVTDRFLTAVVGPGTYNVTVQSVNECGVGAATPVQTLTVP